MVADLTLSELAAMVRTAADPTNDCDSCGKELPGALAPCLPGGDDAHCFVQSCDNCERFELDDAAAEAVAKRFCLNVRRRYDDDTLTYWRPFVTRPGSPEDHDTYCIGADQFGCWPKEEKPVQ